jgi:small subunit ribosomal protein S3Ae
VKKKTKVKEAYTIISPKAFGEKEIGVTFASEPKQLIDRRVILSALELTDNMNKYYLKFLFRIKRVEGEKAFTEFDGSECLQDYISRMVVRRVKRVDIIQDIPTKDGVKLRVKSICILPRGAKESVKLSVSKKIKEMVEKEIGSKSLDDFVKDLISDGIKSKILKEARKIYPVRNFEFRKVEVLRAGERVQES